VRLWARSPSIAGNVGAGFLLERMAPGHLIWLTYGASRSFVSRRCVTPLDKARGRCRLCPRRRPSAAAQSGLSGVVRLEHVQAAHCF